VELNPDNLAAQINAEYNRRCERGDRKRLDGPSIEKQFHDLLAAYRNWGEILSRNGPVDEPTFLFQASQALLPGGNDRQAARGFARCAALAPDWPEPKLWLALSYIDLRDFPNALELTESIQSSGALRDGTGLSQLLMCRTTALQGLGRTNEAAACLEGFISQYRGQADVLLMAAEMFAQNRQFKKELAVLDELLSRDPDNLKLLAAKGWCELQVARYEAATETLTRLLSRDRSNEEARLHRAIARLRAGQLDAAQADFQELLQTTTNSQNALFGLGAIAWRNQDTNAAILLYEQYLSNGVPGLAQYRVAAGRLARLKGK
jgi:tetratricopeptide (TPR) repeat protein